MEYVDLGSPDHELLFYHFYFFLPLIKPYFFILINMIKRLVKVLN